MSSWDTNPWSNFCDSHWELICRNKWHPGTSEISTPPEIAASTYLPWYFYLMEKPLGGYFQVWYSYYQATQCNKKSSIPVSSRWQVRSGKAKKGQGSILITATTRVYLPKPVSTNLIIKPYSVLTKPIGKDVVQSWSMENIYHIRHFYCDTITRIATNQD